MPTTTCPAAPQHLRCEYLVDPLGLDARVPRLSWEVNDVRIGAVQSAYQVLAASCPELLARGRGDVWDTGKVKSDQSVHVAYAGRPLASRERVCWKVRTWDGHDAPSPWSAPAVWEMGLLDRGEWVGQWISVAPREGKSSEPCPFVRRGFALSKPVRRARVYVTARGVYELRLNGGKVGQDYFTPGWTDYKVRIPYQVYDVTSALRQSENVLGAILGDGWACGYLVWEGNRSLWAKQPSLLAQLVIEFADGSTQTIATDATWRATTGPLLMSDIYNGETYDARREMPGWDAPGYDDSAWTAAHVVEPTSALLVAKPGPNVRAISERRPVQMTEPAAGVYVFNMAQNMVGWVRLKIRAAAGAYVRLRFAEMLNKDGTLYTDNLRSAKCTDEYVCKGAGEELYEPRFTFHGFQYVELTGCPYKPSLDAVTAVVLHSDTPPTGLFECSHPMVNKLQSNILWGQKGNFLEVPTDCPQRNERLGWMGDAQVFVRTACFNLDVAAFFEKWMVDVEDAQDTDGAYPDVAPKVTQGKGVAAWADAGVIVPWTVYLCYGDVRILERHYVSMARWIACMKNEARESVRLGRSVTTDLIRPDRGFGDWLAIDAPDPGRAPTPKDLIGAAYFAHCASLMAKIARILGKDADAKEYAELADRVKAAFNREYVTPAGRVLGHTQTSYLLALAFDLLPESLRPKALEHLVNDIQKRGWHLSTGFVGTPLLAPTLTRFGRTDVAYKLLLQDTYPSWFYPIHQGATTMWERWNSFTKEHGFGPVGMNSFNHYAYGSIGEWMYATIAGIDLDP
ncbi:MAG: alpha-L-rhamnosidase, partial [Planctomycetes bacterium]|nr:alpha-L-rhamnosidase [Planctomycetota bacterium]